MPKPTCPGLNCPQGRYLVTWCDDHDEVLMYSLTTRSRLFRPRVAVGPYRITLGRTSLASLPSPGLDGAGPWHALGARRFSYAEQRYFGNPGGYLHWAVGVRDAGSPSTPPIGCEGNTWGGRAERAGVWWRTRPPFQHRL
ncbi:ETEC_3214 domain-containing protein [Streptomyces sp. NPDC048462]|uniref:ETEC_3214 domain-containing protein n=1 Tax=Streptomyces sp. NPDC048462 TaxID=3365555 RepID=UPI00371CAD99